MVTNQLIFVEKCCKSVCSRCDLQL